MFTAVIEVYITLDFTMAITSVRIYYYPLTRERELKLNASYSGFAEWFERRLKPIREQLRGEEAKGVNIVNLMLHENPEHIGSPGEWRRLDNTFEFGHLCDLLPLERQAAIENLPMLMHFYAEVVRQVTVASSPGALRATGSASDRCRPPHNTSLSTVAQRPTTNRRGGEKAAREGGSLSLPSRGLLPAGIASRQSPPLCQTLSITNKKK